MSIPGFAAEASLYQSRRHYRQSATPSYAGQDATVAPQGCDFFHEIFCPVVVAVAAAACYAICHDTPPLCKPCLVAALGVDIGGCIDCLPEWVRDIINGVGNGGGGAGGVGGQRCCPIGTKCSCGGKCMKVYGDGGVRVECVDGVCLRPNEKCP